ncbi:unnamed protein product [Brassica rapa subsp. trilocularis]
MAIEPSRKRLNLSYILLVVKAKRQSYILDNEDVTTYRGARVVETVVIRPEEDVGFGGENVRHLENVEKVENALKVENAEKVEKVENMENVEDAENMGIHVCSCARYVDLPVVVEEVRPMEEREDVMGIEMGNLRMVAAVIKNNFPGHMETHPRS